MRPTSTGRSRCSGSPALLAERLGGGAQAFFCNSGAEANEAALKVARKATGRARIVALEGGFHGRTLGSLSVTGQPAKWEGFGPLVPGVSFAPPNDVESLEARGRARRRARGDRPRADPRRGWRGAARGRVRRRGGRDRARGRCAALGRRGADGARPHRDVLRVRAARARARPRHARQGPRQRSADRRAARARTAPPAAIGPGDHGSTFGGNPVAAAAACAVVEAIDAELLEQVAAAGRSARGRTARAPGRAGGARPRADARGRRSTATRPGRRRLRGTRGCSCSPQAPTCFGCCRRSSSRTRRSRRRSRSSTRRCGEQPRAAGRRSCGSSGTTRSRPRASSSRRSATRATTSCRRPSRGTSTSSGSSRCGRRPGGSSTRRPGTDDADRRRAIGVAMRRYATGVERAGPLVVVSTPSGYASALAQAIDEGGHPGIAGTIAGDNTIFLAPREGTTAAALGDELRELLVKALARRRGRPAERHSRQIPRTRERGTARGADLHSTHPPQHHRDGRLPSGRLLSCSPGGIRQEPNPAA